VTYSESRAAPTVFVAIDDTDNLESRGTGKLVQLLIGTLNDGTLGTPFAATRHQLNVDDRIPYTSHNSSACIALDAGARPDLDAIAQMVGEFLERESADGSDPGLAVVHSGTLEDAVARTRLADFGRRAKYEVLNQDQARALAAEFGVHLSAHGGDGGGIIGALSAIGLHGSGEDGLFLWMPGMRGLNGRATYGELRATVPIDVARDPSGTQPLSSDLIELGNWVRPVLKDGRAVLLLDAPRDDIDPSEPRWIVSAKDVVKSR
jgi:hypothetical protein